MPLRKSTAKQKPQQKQARSSASRTSTGRNTASRTSVTRISTARFITKQKQTAKKSKATSNSQNPNTSTVFTSTDLPVRYQLHDLDHPHFNPKLTLLDPQDVLRAQLYLRTLETEHQPHLSSDHKTHDTPDRHSSLPGQLNAKHSVNIAGAEIKQYLANHVVPHKSDITGLVGHSFGTPGATPHGHNNDRKQGHTSSHHDEKYHTPHSMNHNHKDDAKSQRRGSLPPIESVGASLPTLADHFKHVTIDPHAPPSRSRSGSLEHPSTSRRGSIEKAKPADPRHPPSDNESIHSGIDDHGPSERHRGSVADIKNTMQPGYHVSLSEWKRMMDLGSSSQHGSIVDLRRGSYALLPNRLESDPAVRISHLPPILRHHTSTIEVPRRNTWNYVDNKAMSETSELSGIADRLPILRNGNRMKQIRIGTWGGIILRNTCPFDSVVQCMLNAYIEDVRFARFVQQNVARRSDMYGLLWLLLTEGVKPNVYKQRATLMTGWFRGRKSRAEPGVTRYDCQCNVVDMIDKIMEETPSMVIRRQCDSSFCDLHKPETHDVGCIDANEQMLIEHGIQGLEDAVNLTLSMDREDCLEELPNQQAFQTVRPTKSTVLDANGKVLCAGSLRYTYKLGLCILINVDIVEKANKISVEQHHRLCDFPYPISLKGGKTFYLRGIVAFERGRTASSMGHYVAYCKRTSSYSWELFDDLSPRVLDVDETTTVSPHAVLYTRGDLTSPSFRSN